MAEDYSDDFLIEEVTEGGSSNRPFLIAVGALILIMIIAIAGTTAYVLSGRGDDSQNGAVAERLATNEAIATQNAFVTQTLVARETEAAVPTSTSEPTETSVPTETVPPPATDTPEPTDTPVVVTEVELSDTPTPDFSGAINAGTGTGGTDAGSGGSFTGGGGAGALATPTPISGVAQGSGTLPSTGIEVWSAMGLAMLALAVVVVARRLRTQV